MKHAIIILWHRNIRNLTYLLDYFDEDFDIYLHIDRRAPHSKEVYEGIKEEYPQVNVFRKHRVRWGGLSILKAEIMLLANVVKNTEKYGYVHFISGEDFPLKPLKDFKSFFTINLGREFIEYHHFPTQKWNNGTMARIEQWWINDIFDIKTLSGKQRLMSFIEWQRGIGIKRARPKDFKNLYGGSNWMSITGECAQYVLDYISHHNNFIKRLRFTFASDELCLPTIIMNSSFSHAVTGNNLRFIDWSMGLPSPAYMTESHIKAAMESDAFFARKIGNGISDKFCKIISGVINHVGKSLN